MEEIKVGEYGRTNLGKIIKFAWLSNEDGIRDKNKVILVDLMLTETRPYYYFKKDEFIVKHSKNLIDLIEEGDYVNGEKVVGRGNNCILILTDEGQTFLRNIFEDNDIKSIVTREQFKAIEYRVKTEENNSSVRKEKG